MFHVDCQSLLKSTGDGIVTKKKKKQKERLIFETIRKPTAPPTKKFGREAPEEKVRPSLRKSKHKKPVEIDNE
jgi:hypothetical protein